ncbi:DeoR/GlpR transcriptional regulator [Thermoactinomyces intermedius]|jgi:DeoR family fructose operon transcriptional repressor|uniref:DeoR/GlpR transcriptional regulator n=1 Tax=Thermoactinomyces intermedius TaxID=2024 RepID=A0A8I1ACX4_THEIN|nr:DeoR/GlpR family DNA-binding transcription regulator [Thermoactinomyces intermedius]MBA4549113.1 DeoR/GlpR transcriptional regulator [Thermoactinomyces intermedius]MBA4835674.1 DeoR/GlpR transcriptional regulator [Thermoactinomyces intermedius]MBH8595522.1 DeoR/GlpR transcriptional regulator [Thermoactinomyces intermedius]
MKRQQSILKYVNEHQLVSVAELSEVFEVSEATVRRDLKELEKLGLLHRTHGGAMAKEGVGFEPSFHEKKDRFAKEKRSIAEKAVNLIQEGETILLDTGTTMHQLARLLKHFFRLTVVTNSHHILQELQSSEHLELISTGGTIRKETLSLVGPVAEQMLGMVRVDKAFIGTNGLHLKEGVTTPNLLEAQVKRAMIQSAKEVILLCDHSKINQIAFAKVCSLSSIDILITDKGIPSDVLEGIREKGVDVILA